MTTEYTTEDIRAEFGPGFDEWLTRHDAGVRAGAGSAALEAAAADFARSLTDPAPGCVRGVDETRAWIRARADELRALKPQDTQAASDERRDNRSDEQRPGLTDRPEGEHTEPKLDPWPWSCVSGNCRSSSRSDHEAEFRPGRGFSQDPAHYLGGTR